MTYSVVQVAGHAARREALIELSTTPGLQRSRALAALRSLKPADFAFSVSFGKAVARVRADGGFMPAPTKRGAAPSTEEIAVGLAEPGLSFEDAATLTGLSPAFDSEITPGSAPANKKGPHGAIIPAGLCLLVAPGGVGKSPLSQLLAGFGVESYGIVRAGEPLAGYSSNRDRVARGIAQAMFHHSDVVLDSIKDLLSSAGGSAMKGGISREALLDLSSWASTAAALGVTLYVPLNPSSKNLIAEMIEVATSNATMVFSNPGRKEGDTRDPVTWQWTARTGEGLPRAEGSYDFVEAPTVAVKSSRVTALDMRADPAERVDLRGIVSRTGSKI